MKRILLFIALSTVFAITIQAQNSAKAKAILNKTANIIGHKGGASANFSISSPKIGSASGSIAIKGNKYHARTSQATVWFNGKTQWTYMKRTNEVNVTNPSQAQQQMMNPYTFINIYKSGYKLEMKTSGNNYIVHLTAANKNRSIQEMYITVNKSSYIPSTVKMKQGSTWTTIRIRNFKAKNQPDGIFLFKSKDFPTAEVVDLR